jgi:hypothetical protein
MLYQIKQQAVDLAGKQSWVRKSFIELLDNMNECIQAEGEFTCRGELLFTTTPMNDKEHIYELTFDGVFYITSYNCLEWDYDRGRVELECVPVSMIRKMLKNFPSALNEILMKLRELNEKYQEAERMLVELLATTGGKQ